MKVIFLKKLARLIPFSKFFYLKMNRLINRKFFIKSILYDENLKLIKFSVPKHHIFFGYYDISPFNKKNTKILAIKTKNDTKYKADIGFFNLNNPKKFHKISSSISWCWQQGARLRWFDESCENEVSFNDFKNGKYVNLVVDINSSKVLKIINYPLYDISIDSKLGLSLNFSRLQRLRPGYGYSNLIDNTIQKKCPNDDGIFLIDINNNKKKLIISYSDLVSNFPIKETFSNTHHYFNHLSFNPSSNKFLFFHLMQHDNGRCNRLFYYDLDKNEVIKLEDEFITSHYTWKDDNNILVTSVDPVNSKICYMIYDLKKKTKGILDNNNLNKDGHPTFLDNKSIFISDTYPDINNNQDLFLYDIKKNKKTHLGSFYKGYKYIGEKRCDLHPRISLDSKFVSFDSTHSGLRSQYILNL